MTEKREYIPGFDWVRIFGATSIAFHHIFLSQTLKQWFPMEKFRVMFGLVVPVFFLISGYLLFHSVTRKKNPYRYIKNYLLKYGSIWLALHFLRYLSHYIAVYKETGIFMYKDFAFVMLTLPVRENMLLQLWFIPPLLFGVLVNGILFLKKKEETLGTAVVSVSVIGILLATYGDYFCQLIGICSPGAEGWGKAVFVLITQLLQGNLFVFIGMMLAKNKEKFLQWNYKKRILPVLIFTAAEMLFVYFKIQNPLDNAITISSLFWSVLLLYGMLKIKGQFLQRHHAAIAIYSGLTYFLHIGENTILQLMGCSSAWIRFWILMICNIGLTWLLTRKREQNKRMGNEDRF